MKSGLLACVNMGNMSLCLCRGRLGEYSRQWFCSCAYLRLCHCPLKPKLQCYQCKVYFAIYIWPFQQDSISRLKMSWEDIKRFLKWIPEPAVHTPFSISLWAEQIHGWQWQQGRGRKCGSVCWEYVPWAYFKTKQNKNTCKPFALQEVSVGARDKSHPWKEWFSSLQRTWWTAGKEIPPSLFHFKV